jgi:hypothetical protein
LCGRDIRLFSRRQWWETLNERGGRETRINAFDPSFCKLIDTVQSGRNRSWKKQSYTLGGKN